jgi:hypothetical protein
MRTKTILLTAALVAAGVASSMAQSNVYSLNVVGYVNLTVKPGYNLITLPLQNADPTSSINSVLTNTTPVLPFGSFVSTFNSGTQGYNQAVYAGGDGNWYDGNFVFLVTNSLPPGSGFFLNLLGTSNVTITVVGSVLTGTNTYPVSPGYGFYGQFVPIVGDLTTNGFPIVDNSFLNFFNNPGGYSQAYYGLGTDDSGFDTNGNLTGNPASVPVFCDGNFTIRELVEPAVGQGFLYYYKGVSTATWSQNFTVQ